MTEIRARDMYGNEIVPLGETGYGVSTTWFARPPDSRLCPEWTFFHASDGFRQSLFSVHLQADRDWRDHPVSLCNIFYERLLELPEHGP